MKRILLLGDSGTGCEQVLRALFEGEFAVSSRTDFPAQFVWPDDECPDAVLIQQLDAPGLDFCRRLRRSRRHGHVPVQWLVGPTCTPAQRIEAYSYGVDDCVPFPLEPLEFQARLRARLRMKEAREDQERVRVCGNLKFDPGAGRAWVGEREVALTLKQKELVAYFMDHPRVVVSRQELLGSVWPHASVSARTIDAHLTLLRRKLWDFDHDIQSIHSVGYRLEPARAREAATAGLT